MSLIDWEDVWRSLEWGGKGHSENIEETLVRRADKYARLPEINVLADQDTLKVLVFVQGHERYAVPVQCVVRGVAEPHITPLPCVPDYYNGVINLRGQILSVLNLRRFWALPVVESSEPPKLIVVRAGVFELALLADNVLEMAALPLAEVVPAVTAGVGLAHVQGVSADGIVIVDIESLVTDRRLVIHEEL
jgi:purine-binding chemotaxis protein CheW